MLINKFNQLIKMLNKIIHGEHEGDYAILLGVETRSPQNGEIYALQIMEEKVNKFVSTSCIVLLPKGFFKKCENY